MFQKLIVVDRKCSAHAWNNIPVDRFSIHFDKPMSEDLFKNTLPIHDLEYENCILIIKLVSKHTDYTKFQTI